MVMSKHERSRYGRSRWIPLIIRLVKWAVVVVVGLMAVIGFIASFFF